jgi:hypothetical protein
MKAARLPHRNQVAAGVAALSVMLAAGWALMPHGGKQDGRAMARRRVQRGEPADVLVRTGARGFGPGGAARDLDQGDLVRSAAECAWQVGDHGHRRLSAACFSPAHRHPGSVTAIILEGTIRSQLGGGPVGTYKTGETFFEPPGTLHVFAENPDPVKAREAGGGVRGRRELRAAVAAALSGHGRTVAGQKG